jgi:subtilisin family serine protease
MRKVNLFFVSAMIVVMIVSMFNVSPVYSSNSDNGKVRVFVQFVPGKSAAVEKSLLAAGGDIHYAFDALETFSVSLPEAALEGIAHNPNVVLIEEDAPRYPISIMESTQAVDVPEQVVPYGIDMVQARDVWDVDRDGVVDDGAPTAANRKICIIDSGLFTGHEDLQGLNITGGYPTGWDGDGLGHGTHVAGTIAAMNNALGVIGVTPGTVQLYLVRVFGDDGSWTYASTLIDAANRCASAGANIISMSLGGSKSSVTEKRGFATLYSQGILPIAAAGNDGNTAYSYPASYDSVMSVAAIDEAGVVADFSQQNDQVEVAAPGVGVLSTVPYIDETFVTVNGDIYSSAHIEYSARGTVSGEMVDGGICDTTGAWSGKVVLCARGTISFYDKVMNVQNSGGVAALIYNNEPGNFLGTLGDGYSSTIIGASLSQEDGQYLVASQLGQIAEVTSNYYANVSGYEYYDGTSMATPHASAVAALVWSAKPTATNAEIRDALTATAVDLGTAGRDVAYGYGLVQAKAAIDYLTGGTGGDVALHVADLDGVATLVNSKSWKATVTISVVDESGVPVEGAVVSGAWSGGYTGTATCTTGAAGTCSVVTGNMKTTKSSATFTVSDVSASGYVYDAAANADPDGDSNGTAITVLKP